MDTHAPGARPATPDVPAGDKDRRTALGELRGASPAMNALYDHIERVAAADAPVLITGESGTGKELVARTLHALSARRDRPFVAVNCGALLPERAEAELFGHEKGGVAGACERAGGGTLFLDELGELGPPVQVKLLHVLHTGELLRVGGTGRIPADVRLIAATHRGLDAAQRGGEFRHDLLYRLAVFPLRVPPLREREGDVELLARHFVDQLNAREQAHKALSRRSLDALRGNPWPGNVRELRNAVQRAYIMADHQIELGSATVLPRRRVPRDAEGALRFGVGTSLADAQREILLATLEHFGGDKRRTARVLGISLKTLYNRLGAYGDTRHVRRRVPIAGAAGHRSAGIA